MNERIKELHIQAQQHAFNQPIDIENCTVEDIKGFSQQVYEKFAELIVRECLDVVAMRIYLGPEEICRQECKALASEIKEHFGVPPA
jgi:hypothetical protein